ncbi:MAG: prepilin-type N-terminal cleavage/methylation domain-containing protein [Nitrospirae bacterium]|nr:prepilin-type N-terminal cleavage/methylation domain-containing protein [Nitrospirota bacterium]
MSPQLNMWKANYPIPGIKPAGPGTGCQKRYLLLCNDSRGFTLLELLISLVMIGAIALIATGAMRLGLRTVSAGEKRIDHLERIRASFTIIDSQIQSQIPLSYEEQGERKYYFQGNRGSLQLATNYSLWGGQKGYVLVRYKVESDDTGKQLLSISENIIGMTGNRESKLFRSADAIHFEYFFKDPTEEEGRWVEAWTDMANIPGKIKLHLLYGEKDISMIIPLRTAGTLSQTMPNRAIDKQGISEKKGK